MGYSGPVVSAEGSRIGGRGVGVGTPDDRSEPGEDIAARIHELDDNEMWRTREGEAFEIDGGEDMLVLEPLYG